MLRTRVGRSVRLGVLDEGLQLPGLLRYAVLFDVDGSKSSVDDLCLLDVKEAVAPAAPTYPSVAMPARWTATSAATGGAS